MWIVPVLVLGTAILVGAAVAIHRADEAGPCADARDGPARGSRRDRNRHLRRGAG
ncbi:MAG TPA: hypothetical protein VFC33_07685 [Acidimicrobiia bacterium]|nr:hypothetical protein [Acidimicrobiia bacterium]